MQSPGMTPLMMTFQTKTWLTKPHLEIGATINRTDSYWIYANKHIPVKITLIH